MTTDREIRAATIARHERLAAAWAGHVAATGHQDGHQGRRDVCCSRCLWYFTDETPDAGYQGTRCVIHDEGWAPSASTFVRDLDEQAMGLRE